MDTKTCAKCGGSDLLRVKTSWNYAPIRLGPLTAICPTLLVCATCGYLEQWITDPSDLAKLTKKSTPPGDAE